MENRYLDNLITEICFGNKKMAFVSGPRECGKTTFGKVILKERGFGNYHNWDEIEFRRKWAKNPKSILPESPKNKTPIIILDEIHKSKKWKRELKGIYDTLEQNLDILVTGSARLNVYNKGSDSLLGRYYLFRMHPFSLGELIFKNSLNPDEFLEYFFDGARNPRKKSNELFLSILQFGGFPEPLLVANERRAKLWRMNRIETVVREDLRDLSRIPDLSKIEMLAALLPERVGSLFSKNSIREILETSHETISRWVESLKELYYVFEIKPYQKKIARSIKKEGKIYLWDCSEVLDKAIRFENLVACHLLKATHYWTDGGYGFFDLHFLRNKEKEEIDFLITKDGKPFLAVEVKWKDTSLSPNWKKFSPYLENCLHVQLVHQVGIRKIEILNNTKIHILSASDFLGYLP